MDLRSLLVLSIMQSIFSAMVMAWQVLSEVLIIVLVINDWVSWETVNEGWGYMTLVEIRVNLVPGSSKNTS